MCSRSSPSGHLYSGAYAEKKAKEITAEGKYKGVCIPAVTGEAQVDLVQMLIANGDAAGVVFSPWMRPQRLGRQFRTPFRKREPWTFQIEDFE